jgi:hypothetical protein
MVRQILLHDQKNAQTRHDLDLRRLAARVVRLVVCGNGGGGDGDFLRVGLRGLGGCGCFLVAGVRLVGFCADEDDDEVWLVGGLSCSRR